MSTAIKCMIKKHYEELFANRRSKSIRLCLNRLRTRYKQSAPMIFLKPHDLQNWTAINVKSHNEPFKTGFRSRDFFVSELSQINMMYAHIWA